MGSSGVVQSANLEGRRCFIDSWDCEDQGDMGIQRFSNVFAGEESGWGRKAAGAVILDLPRQPCLPGGGLVTDFLDGTVPSIVCFQSSLWDSSCSQFSSRL